jgi:hypothetical protein
MQIEEYIKTFFKGKKSVEYKIKSVVKLSEEFKARNLETYLWLDHREIESIIGTVKEAAKGMFNKPIRKKIVDTVNPLLDVINLYISDDLITFIYSYIDKKHYYLANELSKQAKHRVILPNLFGDNATVNILVAFDKGTQLNEAYLCYETMCNVSYSSSSRMHQPYVNGYKIFNKCLDNIVSHADYNGKPCLMTSVSGYYGKNLHSYCAGGCRIDNDVKKIMDDRNAIDKVMDSGLFRNELEMSYSLMKLLMYKVHDMFIAAKETFDGCRDKLVNANVELEILYSRLTKEERVPVKWDTEKELFKLVSRYYSDAIFQHSPSWLHPQNIDIYVPSIGLAIEYNGKQHYESIDFFGGDEGLKHRMELDEKKVKVCKDNGVKVLHWKYNVEVNVDNFVIFMLDNGISL